MCMCVFWYAVCMCVSVCSGMLCERVCVRIGGFVFFLEVDGKFLKRAVGPFCFGISFGIYFSIESILGSLGEEPSSVISTLPPLFRDSL